MNKIKIGGLSTDKYVKQTVQTSTTNRSAISYMSPEILENSDYDSRTDMWSLGCVTYEMLTFAKTFDLVTGGKDPLIDLSKNIPEELDIILKK